MKKATISVIIKAIVYALTSLAVSLGYASI